MGFDLSISKILLVAGFVVPGAISLRIYRLLKAVKKQSIQSEILEAVVFSIINFVIIFPLLYNHVSIEDNIWTSYAVIVFCFFVTPVIWPVMFIKIIQFLSDNRIILIQSPTAWDHFFSRLKSGVYIIVHLNDGGYIGGEFGKKSYASTYPEQGQLFLERAWEVDEDGNFVDTLPGEPGIILQPEQYTIVRVFGGLEDDSEEKTQSVRWCLRQIGRHFSKIRFRIWERSRGVESYD